MTAYTNSRDRERETGRKRKGKMRRKGERWLEGKLIREDKNIYPYRYTLVS